MIFVTVGTQFPFDRMVEAVDKAVEKQLIKEDIYAQIGNSRYRPRNFKAVQYLNKRSFDECVRKASGVITHAGIGTIMIALDYAKPVLAVPRLESFGEVVNDHQIAIARKFEHLGLIMVVHKMEDLPENIERLKSFVPAKKHHQTKEVVNRIQAFLKGLNHH